MTKQENQDMEMLRDDASKQFAGLPMGLLISQPILEAAKGQAALCQVYLQTIYQLAFVDGDPEKGTKTVNFSFKRLIMDPKTGQESTKDMSIEVPLISLVPLPAFTMDEATVDFSMEIHEQAVDSSNNTESVTNTDSLNFWGCNASITGTVSATTSHTRTTDNTSKYIIHARAVQQPPSEGMAKLTSLFAASMEPMEKKT
ncbi:DUF2589 domain-containing protein [Pseudoflavonifractor sp. An85]|uniref:DUF2589 domain-containing protein n=1 Tax=Pseudoflavonifractor sp. An85 TaxID=1965661 RepID=UPI00194DBA73|nr:DUF2589 domain-containing protein [Pseudoflavonifractor sp. An85]